MQSMPQLLDNPTFINESEICLRTDSEARTPEGSQGEGPVSQEDDARQGALQKIDPPSSFYRSMVGKKETRKG